MGLLRVSSERNGSFLIQTEDNLFEVSRAERERGTVRTSNDLARKLAESAGRSLTVTVHYYKDIDGNEYVMTGQIPHTLPNTKRDEL